MTSQDYKATPELWAHMECCADNPQDIATLLLELRSRVEALEAGLKDEADCNRACTLNLSDRLIRVEQRVRELQAARNAEINWQGEQDGRLKATEERLAILENAENGRQQEEDAERAAEPDSTGSLVERVAHVLATCNTGEDMSDWAPEARAAILEVAAWMRENDTGYNAVRWLEMEADNSRSQEGYD